MRRTILLICICIGFFLAAYSQAPQPAIKTFKIGDTIPDIVFTHFLDGKDDREKASDLYKQGGLIINFWATWCVPCISALPRLDSLQKAYGPHFNMICLTYQDSTEVSTFFAGHPKLKPKYLNIITSDTFLYKVFPHHTIPHNVWVDKNGIIKAISGDEDVTRKNIRSLIAGKDFKFTLKTDDISFNDKKPLDVKDNQFIDRSIITGYRPDINNGGNITRWDSTHSLIKRYLGWNRTIIDFIWHAYHPNLNMVNYKSIELHVADSTRFLWPERITDIYIKSRYKNRKQWENDNVYCYELCFSKGVKENLFCSYIKQDIERYFDITTRIENKKISCWVITGNPDKHVFKRSTSKQIWQQLTGNGRDSATLIIRNRTLLDIMNFFHGKPNYDPYVNKTNIDYPIDVTLHFTHLKDGAVPVSLLKQKMEQYGFIFKKKIQSYPVIVISDKH